MKTDVNLEMYRTADTISTELRNSIHELEQEVEDFCVNFVKTQEDLQMLSLFQFMLDDLHSDLERIDNVRSILYN
jgi:hypothetical protein